jgi:diguanylate cyclase (GGDEF)-like protein
LIGVSRLLLSSLREVDSVGRIGGEEFLILARETDENGANSLAERIRSRIEASPIDYRGTQVRITVSIGVAVAESRVPVEYTQMYNVAAEALNQAKASGRNRCIIRRSVQPRYLRLCPDSL